MCERNFLALIAKWNGSAWSALSGPTGTGVGGYYPYVYALTVFDDGSGTALYAGGYFTTAGGIASSRISAWRCDEGPLVDGLKGEITVPY